MKILKKLPTMVILSACFWASTTTIAMPSRPENTAAAHSKAAKTASLLFTLDSERADLIHIGGKKFALRVPLQSVKKVLAFSDRPYHFVIEMTPSAFAKAVHSGSNSFDQNPPNAALTIYGHPTAIFEITSYHKDRHFIYYDLLQVGKNKFKHKKISGRLTLTIDDLAATATVYQGTNANITQVNVGSIQAASIQTAAINGEYISDSGTGTECGVIQMAMMSYDSCTGTLQTATS